MKLKISKEDYIKTKETIENFINNLPDKRNIVELFDVFKNDYDEVNSIWNIKLNLPSYSNTKDEFQFVSFIDEKYKIGLGVLKNYQLVFFIVLDKSIMEIEF